ncbi:MAG TPA: hypothetical protein VMY34_05045, partial [Acidimicrobiales bacterium]|nr:hypothetical protein [Acidimicrobiales bacterium]
ATFVHDWLSFLIVVVLVLHLRFALKDQDAFRGMRQGWVTLGWARRHHPRWAAAEEEKILAPSREGAGSSQP